MVRNRADSWTGYWAAGALHSCGESFDGELGPASQIFWSKMFDLVAENQTVLELGSGNGALLKFLAEKHMYARKIHAVGVDLASIQPSWVTQLPPKLRESIKFISGVKLENLPLESACADLVLSQFALEYTDLAKSIPHVARVSRDGARLAMLIHHVDARPVQASAEEAAHAKFLLDADGLYSKTDRLIPYMALTRTERGRARLQNDPEAGRCRDAFNAAVAEVKERAKNSSVPDLLHNALQGCSETLRLAQESGRELARRFHDQQCNEIENAELRHSEAVQYAMDGAAINEFSGRLHQAGFEDIAFMPFYEAGETYAWSVTARKASSGA